MDKERIEPATAAALAAQRERQLLWARAELAYLQDSAVRNPGQEQQQAVIISRLERDEWSHPDIIKYGGPRATAQEITAGAELGTAEQAAWNVAVQRGLNLSHADVQAMIAAAVEALPFAHAIEPAPDLDLNPVFDCYGREIENYEDTEAQAPSRYPLSGTCRCCRPIVRIAHAAPWGHGA